MAHVRDSGTGYGTSSDNISFGAPIYIPSKEDFVRIQEFGLNQFSPMGI